MTTITRVKTPRGDMEFHVGGCSDITKKSKSYDEAQDYTADTLLAAIEQADADMANWFGQDAYETDADETAWTVRNCEWAPCFVKAVKAEKITFGAQDRPAVGPVLAVEQPYVVSPVLVVKTRVQDHQCLCGCGGSPKGKNSRFLPGHDARMKGTGSRYDGGHKNDGY